MSFYSSLFYYRPGPPALVTTENLAAYLRAFEKLEISEISHPELIQLRFRRATDVDQDRPWGQANEPGTLDESNIDWDVNEATDSLTQMAVRVAGASRIIHRASINLGMPKHSIFQTLMVDTPENLNGFAPDTWTLEIGPVESFALDSDRFFFVGWVAIRLHGNGYFFPRTLAEMAGRAEQNADLQRVMELCRSTWPVEGKVPDRRQIQARRAIGELWPYPTLERPWDWYWGGYES